MGLSLMIYEKTNERVTQILNHEKELQNLEKEIENPSQELAANWKLFQEKQTQLTDLLISDISLKWEELGYLRKPHVLNYNLLESLLNKHSHCGYIVDNEKLDSLLLDLKDNNENKDLVDFIEKSRDKILLISL